MSWQFFLKALVPFAATVSPAAAEDLFSQLDVGHYAIDGSCNDPDSRWWVLDAGIITSAMVCLNLDGSRNGDGYYLYMECGGRNGNVTYMGPWTVEPPATVVIELTEYRGGSGAPDLNIRLERCGG